MNKLFCIVSIAFLIGLNSIVHAQSWQPPPPGNPPTQNTYPPLDTSGNNQTKVGSITAQGGLKVGSADQFQVDSNGILNLQSASTFASLANFNGGLKATGNGFTIWGVNNGTTGNDIAVNGQAVNGGWAGYFFGPLGTNGSMYISGLIAVSTSTPKGKFSLAGGSKTITTILVDNPNGYTGNLLDLKVASSSKFILDKDGVIKKSTLLGGTLGNYQLLMTTGGVTPDFFKYNQWLYRDAAGTDWQTARLFDGITVNGVWSVPHDVAGPRVWSERDPKTFEFKWGSAGVNGQDMTFMTLNQYVLSLFSTTPHAGALFEVVNPASANADYVSVQTSSPTGLSIRSTTLPSGNTPYIDFYNDTGAVQDARIILESDDVLKITGANLKMEYPTIDVKNESLYLNGDGDVQIRIDANDNTTNTFKINNGGNSTVLEVNESGTTKVSRGLRLAEQAVQPTCDVNNAGEMIYFVQARASALSMCMLTGTGIYTWVNIKVNSW